MPKDKWFNKKFQKFALSSKLLVFSFLLLALCSFIWLLYPDKAISGPYLDSAHRNSTYGVNRTSLTAFSYSIGNCVHCHEQHASIGGSEPNPTGGPDKYALFYTNHVTQTDNFCFKCHTDMSSYQMGGLINRSYSYRAGGWNSDTLNDILEAFSFTSPATSHNLEDISTFVSGRWGYTSDSNPCAACHNPHRAKGDPANSPNSSKSSVTRSYSPVSRPSMHSKDNNAWSLWGANSERMNVYASSKGGFYQAPYFNGSSAKYEPDGSTTQDGSNLTDFPTLCTDCHNNSNAIYSTLLGRNLYQFDFSQEMHGGWAANYCHGATITLFDLPYDGFKCPQNYVLSCTDCHEPHGSSNNYLIRKEVNYSNVPDDSHKGIHHSLVTVTQYGNGVGPVEIDGNARDHNEWTFLCQNCHTWLWCTDTWINPNTGLPQAVHVHPQSLGCAKCHGAHGGMYRNCQDCHFHGNSSIDGVPYGKPLF